MFFLLSFVFDVLDSFIKPIIGIVALVLIAQIVGIDVMHMVEQFIQTQIQNAISPF